MDKRVSGVVQSKLRLKLQPRGQDFRAWKPRIRLIVRAIRSGEDAFCSARMDQNLHGEAEASVSIVASSSEYGPGEWGIGDSGALEPPRNFAPR